MSSRTGVGRPLASVAGWMTEVPTVADDPTGPPVAILSSTLSSCSDEVGLLGPKPGKQLRLFSTVRRVRVHRLLTLCSWRQSHPAVAVICVCSSSLRTLRSASAAE